MLEIQEPTTREFVPDYYSREIFALVNGRIDIPATEDVSTYRVITVNVQLSSRIKQNADPFCVLSRESKIGSEEYARTEVQWYSPQPKWIRPFTLCFRPGATELLQFDIYDAFSTSQALTSQIILGGCQLDLGALVDSPTKCVDVDVVGHGSDKTLAQLHVTYWDIQPQCFGALMFKFIIRDLATPSHNIFRKKEPFFEIFRLHTPSGTFIPVYKSATREKDKATWEHVDIPLQYLCGGDMTQIIRICLYDFVILGSDHFVGFVDTTVEVLLSSPTLSIHNERGEVTASIEVVHLARITRPRFGDYRLKGVQISPMLAVDFSSSKVSFLKTNRVQHIDNGVITYGNLINGVFDNIRHICGNQRIAAYGFADFPGEKLVPLSLNKTRRQMKSVKALMSAYTRFRDKIEYPKTACLAPVIAEARSVAKARWEENHAITLVIVLTNGVFCDLQEAINELVEAANEPIMVTMAVIGGTRRELDTAFLPPGKRLQHMDGRSTQRAMVSLIRYEKNCICADQSLETRLMPGIRRMALEWLDVSGFNPFECKA